MRSIIDATSVSRNRQYRLKPIAKSLKTSAVPAFYLSDVLPLEEMLSEGDPANHLPPGEEQLHRPLLVHQDPGGLQEEVMHLYSQV